MPNVIGNTKNLSEEEWLNWRQHGKGYSDPSSPDYIPVTVGGSLVSSIFNVSPWSNILEAYNNKVGIEPAIKKEFNASAKKAGHRFEPYVAEMFKEWCEIHGLTCKIINDTKMYQHSKYPFALANIDRKVVINGKRGLLECKTTNPFYSAEWENGKVPFYYELQCRFYMEVMNMNFCYICCCWGFTLNDMAVIRIDRDRALGKTIMDKCADFVQHVIDKVPPTVDDIDKENLTSYYFKLYGEPEKKEDPVLLPFTLRDQIEELIDVEQKIKVANSQLAQLKKERIRLAADFYPELKDNNNGIYEIGDDKIEITLSIPHFASTFDNEKFKAEHPDLYEKFKIETVDTKELDKVDKNLRTQYMKAGEINVDEASKKTSVSAKVIKPKKTSKGGE